ncbi:CRE-PQN-83 protein [Caenorhabditis remanei]|uniref:CRE-PQN-83 protein n=1 Tax=Caenorhabditis remanei TaxID=31234 RepID=E3LWA7_CAERE|nr:CRE-PQN-83 protein [Caenorhabditis remanei]
MGMNYTNKGPNMVMVFRPGTGLGSQSSSGTFKKALIGGALGAAGGILAYEAGKAIIKSATEPFNYNGRNYNWDNHGQVKNGEFQCSMPLNQLTQQQSTTTSTTTTTTTGAPDASTTVNPVSTTPTPDQVLQNIQYPDGSRPKTIVWACKQGREVCCGTDCCPAPVQNQNNGGAGGSHGSTGSSAGTIALVVLLILLLLCCGCCIGAYFCCRSIFDCGDDKHDNQQYHDDYSQQQQYQMQNYPPQQQQQQGGYYQQPQGQYQQGYPQGGNYYPQQNNYPSHPTY